MLDNGFTNKFTKSFSIKLPQIRADIFLKRILSSFSSKLCDSGENGPIHEVEKIFNELVNGELQKIKYEYIVRNRTDDSKSDYSSEISSEDGVIFYDDGEVPKKNYWKNLNHNYRDEYREDILLEKMLKREEN
ncbi:hypothetical protein LXL04_036843 [Taraxacum kok-saghyz]